MQSGQSSGGARGGKARLESDFAVRVLTDAEWKLLPEAVKRFCAGKIRLHGGRAQLLE